MTERLDEYLKAKPANVYLCVPTKSDGNLIVGFEKFPFYSINELIKAMHGGPLNLTEKEFQVEKEKSKGKPEKTRELMKNGYATPKIFMTTLIYQLSNEEKEMILSVLQVIFKKTV